MMAIMMRNLILIGAILLASASASLCGFWKSENPVSVLNEYLAANVASDWKQFADDFADNMEAIDKYKPGQKDKKVEQLASLLSNLDRTFDRKNLCTESNLKALRQTFEAVSSYDTESFKEPKRKMGLNRLLYIYFYEAWEGCGRFYKENRQETYDRLEKIGLNFWSEVDDIIRQHAYRFLVSTSDKFLLMGAFRLLQGEWQPSGVELKGALQNMMKLRPPIEAAKELVSTYLYPPCKVLLDDAEAQTIVGPMTDLGSAMVLSGLYRPIRESAMWESVRWASRNIFCKWVIGAGEDQLAKMIL